MITVLNQVNNFQPYRGESELLGYSYLVTVTVTVTHVAPRVL